MTKDLLIEIGLEEVPARFVQGGLQQFKEKIEQWMQEHRLTYEQVKEYATPRRMAILVKGLSERQPDITEEVRGPSRKIALSESGEWTKAAVGFARGQGIDPENLSFKDVKGVAYVFATKHSAGAFTRDLLEHDLQNIIASLSFPKNMRWGAYKQRYIRPIRWLVSIYGEDIIPIEIAGVQSGRTTRGHRFLGGTVEISTPSTYTQVLEDQFVYAEIDQRKQIITTQIEQLAQKQGWQIPIDEKLLEEIVFLVEYPTVLYGSFQEEFLEIPQEVLITSMREHQRYFPVLDAAGNMLPYFVTVRNGNDDHLDTVARGNEKVLRARLADARFFYQEDLKMPIEVALERLNNVVYHEGLGTIADKVRRIRALAQQLTAQLNLSEQQVSTAIRAAELSKFDLVTLMVDEFPELQGFMGEDYARQAGESAETAKAIYEHYLPRFAGDQLPQTTAGSLVSLADKMDSIIACFSIGIVPTGSQDPYALRRQAVGIVQILLENELPFTLEQLFEAGLMQLESQQSLQRSAAEITIDLQQFFALRVRNLLSKETRYDVIDAIMAAGYSDVGAVVRKSAALTAALTEPDVKPFVEAVNRVYNLAANAESLQFNKHLFTELAEKKLCEKWEQIDADYFKALTEKKESEALQKLMELADSIHHYFDEVMVMDENLEQRKNRLGFLAYLSKQFSAFADFSKLVREK